MSGLPLRTVIVDDEPLARDRIATLLAAEPDMEVVAQCGDGEVAVAAIRAHQPDIVFLDIQMPGSDGFSVLERVGVGHIPVVIFVTAFDDHALRAFEMHALDYLLKPFDRTRFFAALNRARQYLQPEQRSAYHQRLAQLIHDQTSATPYLAHIPVKTNDRVILVSTDTIDWVETAGNYVHLHVGATSHLLRTTMSRLESQLDPAQFVRIHRYTMVNLTRIRDLRPYEHGDFLVTLQDGTQLRLSRTYRERLQRVLGDYF